MMSPTRYRQMPARLASLLAALATALGSSATALVLAVSLGALASACDKPKEADCKKAVTNIRRIYETQGSDYGVDPKAMIRSCRGSASRESVQCFIAAKTMEDIPIKLRASAFSTCRSLMVTIQVCSRFRWMG